MPGSLRIYPINSPKTIFEFGQLNAFLLSVLSTAVLEILGKGNKASVTAGIIIYVWYMLQAVHRRVFVLHNAPPTWGIFGGYLGDEKDYWNFVTNTNTSMMELERSFWKYFWFPIIILVMVYSIGYFTQPLQQ